MLEKKSIIIDIGTELTKFGLSTDLEPYEIPTVIGRSRLSLDSSGGEQFSFAGVLALKNRRRLNLEYPIKNGEIVDWIGFKKIIMHVYFNEMVVNTEDFPVVIAVPFNLNKENHQKIKDLFFDELGVPSMAIIDQPLLSLRVARKSTGLVVEMGEGLTQITPIYENEIIQCGVKIFPITGSSLTSFLKNLLNEKQHMFLDGVDDDNVRGMKEALCRVRLNENELPQAINHELSDGKHITIDDEIFKCPEALFTPSLMGLNSRRGINEEILDSISTCDATIQQDLMKNIVLSGGGSSFENFPQRLEMELKKITNFDVKVEGIVDGKFAPWIGGSILAGDEFFENYLTKNPNN